MTEPDKTLSPAMRSALQAVARMKGDAAPDAALWAAFLETMESLAAGEVDRRRG